MSVVYMSIHPQSNSGTSCKCDDGLNGGLALSSSFQDSFGHDIPESATCNIRQDRYLSHAFEASTFLFFIAPITVIGILYGLIGLAIRRSTLLTRVGSDTSSRGVVGGPRADRLPPAEQQRAQQLQARARLAVIKMLGTYTHSFRNTNEAFRQTARTTFISVS